MAQAILYRNEAGTIFLLDLPASLQNGQNAINVLRSSAALKSPYLNTEPKGAKREAALAAISPGERSYHHALQWEISLALAEIRDNMRTGSQRESWCHPRSALITYSEFVLPHDVSVSTSTVPAILSTTERRTNFASLNDLANNMVFNVQPTTATINVTAAGNFAIPPRSTFLPASLGLGFPVFSASRELFSPNDIGFDLILMDPPWSNRSARHAGAYKMQENQAQDPFEQALRVVKSFIAPKGCVAVWVTNKSSIRARVIKSFLSLGYHLQEHWLWIKVTSHGEPVTQLDGVWRRPYETLLLLREEGQFGQPECKVIAAVPDLHSRKPCLKMLFDKLLPPGYRALELFARSLTAGWWSWGDEVLKFQHESHWTGGEEFENDPLQSAPLV